jgi:hypothetical protein
MLTTTIDEEFAHLKMPLGRSEEEAGLTVVVEMVYVDTIL